MFGSGPSEEIRLETRMAKHEPIDEQTSKARYDDHLDGEQKDADAGRRPSALERFKRWFSARF
jgi:hypothetical protein